MPIELSKRVLLSELRVGTLFFDPEIWGAIVFVKDTDFVDGQCEVSTAATTYEQKADKLVYPLRKTKGKK